MARCQTILLLLSLAIPVRKPVVPEHSPPPPPIFSGQWGPYTLYQFGDTIVIDSKYWHATGLIGLDGAIKIHWFSCDGKIAFGTYHLEGVDRLVGKWQYAGFATMYTDVVWRTKD